MVNPTQAALRATYPNIPSLRGKPPLPTRHCQRTQHTPTTAYVCFVLAVCLLIGEHCILAYIYGNADFKKWMYTGVLLLKETLYAYALDVYSALPAGVLTCAYWIPWILCVLAFRSTQ